MVPIVRHLSLNESLGYRSPSQLSSKSDRRPHFNFVLKRKEYVNRYNALSGILYEKPLVIPLFGSVIQKDPYLG
jgi:hypothetical protein